MFGQHLTLPTFISLTLTAGVACSGSDSTNVADARAAAVGDDGRSSSGMFFPKPGTSWQWQLSGSIDLSIDAAVYDIDPFAPDTPTDTIAKLHAAGRKVICYFDCAYEPGRSDTALLEPFKGNPIEGWPGQFWVDFRQPQVRAVMQARIDKAVGLGCDAVEPDDIDAIDNNPGFPLTAADQLDFATFLAVTAHSRGLSVGLKNNLAQVAQLVSVFDFAVNEQCFEYNECETLKPFIAANKAVFNTEYTSGDLQQRAAQVCAAQNTLNFDSIVKRLELGPERVSCR
jgi:hypothetical protein